MAPVAGRIEWVEDRVRLAELAHEWDILAQELPSPFGDHAWFLAWWDAFGHSGLRVCLLWDGDELLAALPLCTTAGGLKGLANYHTPEFTVPARDRESLTQVVHEALRWSRSELALHAVREDDPLAETVAQASERERQLLVVEPLHRSPRVDLAGDFESFGRGRGRQFKDVARRWRKLSRERVPRFRFGEPVQDLDGELSRAYELEAAGWKGRQKTAIASTPQTQTFYTAIARAYHARGELCLIWLDIDNQPAAFNFCLLRAGRLYALKVGIDDRMRPYAPGLMIDYCTIQRAFELGLESYELLGADEHYKRGFANGWSDHVGLRSYRRRPAGMTRYLTRRFGRPALRAARQRLGL